MNDSKEIQMDPKKDEEKKIIQDTCCCICGKKKSSCKRYPNRFKRNGVDLPKEYSDYFSHIIGWAPETDKM